MGREAMVGGSRSAAPRFGLLLPVIAIIVVLVCAVFGVAWLAAGAQDRLAVEATRHTVHSVINGNRSELGGWSSDYAYWDAFVENVIVSPDMAWIDDNVGRYAQENLEVDITLVLDGTYDPVVISTADDLELGDALSDLPQDLAILAKNARADVGPVDRRPIAQQSYVQLGGQVFMVAAAVAKWEDREELPTLHGGPVVLMYLRKIDDDLLARFSRDFIIDGLRLIPAEPVVSNALALTGVDGRVVAQLDWMNPRPGTEFLRGLMAPMIAILVIAVIAMAWIVRRIRSVFAQFRAAHATLNQRTEALRIARDEADRANRAKTEFLAQMSHDLRTPLNAILGFSEVIALQTFGSDAAAFRRYQDYARQIHRGGDHLRALIDSILDIARLDAGRYELRPTDVPLDAAIDTCLVLLRETLDAKGFTVTAPRTGLVVRGDQGALDQVLLNLIGNAAKYTPPGGRIEVEAQKHPGGVAVSVRDNGIGMSKEDADSAFELFTRGHSSADTLAEGAGIGLSIVKRLIDLHGGTIEIASELGTGTTVTFVLPEAGNLPGAGPVKDA